MDTVQCQDLRLWIKSTNLAKLNKVYVKKTWEIAAVAMPVYPAFRRNFRLDFEHQKYIAPNFLQLKSKTLKEITVQIFA